MKRTTSGDSYFFAICTASLMATPCGMSGMYSSSNIATRMMAEATRLMRSKRQPFAYFSMSASSSAACSATPLTRRQIYCFCFSLGVCS